MLSPGVDVAVLVGCGVVVGEGDDVAVAVGVIVDVPDCVAVGFGVAVVGDVVSPLQPVSTAIDTNKTSKRKIIPYFFMRDPFLVWCPIQFGLSWLIRTRAHIRRISTIGEYSN